MLCFHKNNIEATPINIRNIHLYDQIRKFPGNIRKYLLSIAIERISQRELKTGSNKGTVNAPSAFFEVSLYTLHVLKHNQVVYRISSCIFGHFKENAYTFKGRNSFGIVLSSS